MTSDVIQHIIWKAPPYNDEPVSGLLKFRVVWHGGGDNTIIATGTYSKEDWRGKFVYDITRHEISEHTMGVSGVDLIAIGTII